MDKQCNAESMFYYEPNRRLRIRMSGGVRGRGLVTPSYSIIFVKYWAVILIKISDLEHFKINDMILPPLKILPNNCIRLLCFKVSKHF